MTRIVPQAKTIEETFIQRFEARLGLLASVFNPLDGKRYDATSANRRLFRRNRNAHVVETLKRAQRFERELLKTVPLDEALHCAVSSRSFFGRRSPRVMVIGAVRSPLAALLHDEPAPLGPLDVDEVVGALVKDPKLFYYVGICATTSWNEAAFDRLPLLDNAVVCLLESTHSTAWRLKPQNDPRWNDLAPLFDPESDEEKVARVRRMICEHPTLSLRGGHLRVNEIASSSGVDGALLDKALQGCTALDAELSLTEIDGIKIVKRARL